MARAAGGCCPAAADDTTQRAHALAEALLDRYGVVTRGAVTAERLPGGFAAVYPVLRAFEETGRCRRGYFVEGLGAAQFALPGAVDRLRATSATATARPTRGAARPAGTRGAVVLAATDPANPYGAALPWPDRPGEARGHKPGRKAGALVVLVDGHLVALRRTRRQDPAVLRRRRRPPARRGRAGPGRPRGALGKLTVERADGAAINDSPLGAALESAGFHPTPRGLRLRA